jgi:hypothetical protein
MRDFISNSLMFNCTQRAGLREDSAFFSFSQVFRKIRQSHQNNGQARYVYGINPAVEHSRNDSGKRQADKGSDYEN